ncbi:hypothetical protein BO443_160056 [Burkholderia orbicola]
MSADACLIYYIYEHIVGPGDASL